MFNDIAPATEDEVNEMQLTKLDNVAGECPEALVTFREAKKLEIKYAEKIRQFEQDVLFKCQHMTISELKKLGSIKDLMIQSGLTEYVDELERLSARYTTVVTSYYDTKLSGLLAKFPSPTKPFSSKRDILDHCKSIEKDVAEVDKPTVELIKAMASKLDLFETKVHLDRLTDARLSLNLGSCMVTLVPAEGLSEEEFNARLDSDDYSVLNLVVTKSFRGAQPTTGGALEEADPSIDANSRRECAEEFQHTLDEDLIDQLPIFRRVFNQITAPRILTVADIFIQTPGLLLYPMSEAEIATINLRMATIQNIFKPLKPSEMRPLFNDGKEIRAWLEKGNKNEEIIKTVNAYFNSAKSILDVTDLNTLALTPEEMDTTRRDLAALGAILETDLTQSNNLEKAVELVMALSTIAFSYTESEGLNLTPFKPIVEGVHKNRANLKKMDSIEVKKLDLVDNCMTVEKKSPFSAAFKCAILTLLTADGRLLPEAKQHLKISYNLLLKMQQNKMDVEQTQLGRQPGR